MKIRIVVSLLISCLYLISTGKSMEDLHLSFSGIRNSKIINLNKTYNNINTYDPKAISSNNKSFVSYIPELKLFNNYGKYKRRNNLFLKKENQKNKFNNTKSDNITNTFTKLNISENNNIDNNVYNSRQNLTCETIQIRNNLNNINNSLNNINNNLNNINNSLNNINNSLNNINSICYDNNIKENFNTLKNEYVSFCNKFNLLLNNIYSALDKNTIIDNNNNILDKNTVINNDNSILDKNNVINDNNNILDDNNAINDNNNILDDNNAINDDNNTLDKNNIIDNNNNTLNENTIINSKIENNINEINIINKENNINSKESNNKGKNYLKNKKKKRNKKKNNTDQNKNNNVNLYKFVLFIEKNSNSNEMQCVLRNICRMKDKTFYGIHVDQFKSLINMNFPYDLYYNNVFKKINNLEKYIINSNNINFDNNEFYKNILMCLQNIKKFNTLISMILKKI